jgi:hypothetical protein
VNTITPPEGFETWDEFYEADADAFLTRKEQASSSAPALDDPDTRTNGHKAASTKESFVRVPTRMTPGHTPALALEKDILGTFLADLRRSGVAGEECLAQLEYLALTSRVLPWGRAGERPISLLAKGTSSTGKSFTTSSVLRFFPPEAYFDVGSFSPRFLFYTEETFEHRFIVFPEWASIKDDEEIVAMLRVLLSEGRIIHGTVVGEGRREARVITKNGPTGLLVTTTESAIDSEMETPRPVAYDRRHARADAPRLRRDGRAGVLRHRGRPGTVARPPALDRGARRDTRPCSLRAGAG